MERSSLSSDSGSFGYAPGLLAVVLAEECHKESCSGSSKFARNRRPDPGASCDTSHESSPAGEFSIVQVGAHAPRRVLKRQTSQVRNTRTVGHAQPKRIAIERVSPLSCDGSLEVLPWEVKAQATFNAQPVATAIAAAARPFKRERDLSSQKSTTGSRRAVSNRAVVANFCMMSLKV